MHSTLVFPRQLTVRKAAEVYSIPESTLRAYISRGVIPHRHVGRRVYIPVSKFEAWLALGDVDSNKRPGGRSNNERN